MLVILLDPELGPHQGSMATYTVLLIRYHYLSFAPQHAAQLLSVWPRFGYRFCKYSLNLVCFLMLGVRLVKVNFLILWILWERI